MLSAANPDAALALVWEPEGVDLVVSSMESYLGADSEIESTHPEIVEDPRVTISASEVLRERVGLCYAKSHLLAALLRAEGIPAGLCYQRLGNEHDGFALHGLIASCIDGAWHRQDPRGNKPGIDAQFSVDQLSVPNAMPCRKPGVRSSAPLLPGSPQRCCRIVLPKSTGGMPGTGGGKTRKPPPRRFIAREPRSGTPTTSLSFPQTAMN